MPYENRRNEHLMEDDGRWRNLSGVGPVPTGPRGSRSRQYEQPQGRLTNRHFNLNYPNRHNRYHDSDTPRRHSGSDEQIFSRAHGDADVQNLNMESNQGPKRPDESPTKSMPEYRDPLQFLAEGFARRQREIRDEAVRQQVQYGHRTRDNAHYRHEVEQDIESRRKRRKSPVKSIMAEEGVRIKLEDIPESSIDSLRITSPQASLFNSTEGSVDEAQSPKNTAQRSEVQETRQDIGPQPADPDPDPESPTVSNGPVCKCPIGFACEAKLDNRIDCRTLVLEKDWSNWLKRQEKEYPLTLPPDIEPEEESFMTPQDVAAVIKILDKIEIRPRMSMAIRTQFRHLQDWILKAQSNSVTQESLDQSLVLKRLEMFLSEDNEVMRRQQAVPIAIVENLTIIYRKWQRGDLSVLARRGLIRAGGSTTFSADPTWLGTRSADYFGHGDLVNGQTWGSRAEMSRDGAHGPLIAGISGSEKSGGARSIVMGYHDSTNKQYYADVDEGDTIWYMGTALSEKNPDTAEPTNVKDATQHTPHRVIRNREDGPTPGTQALIMSCTTGNPVRVFRSFRLAKIVPHRPERGFRYDGLYRVTQYKLLKKERQIYQFKLERLTSGQGPLRENVAPPKPAPLRKRPREEGSNGDDDGADPQDNEARA